MKMAYKYRLLNCVTKCEAWSSEFLVNVFKFLLQIWSFSPRAVQTAWTKSVGVGISLWWQHVVIHNEISNNMLSPLSLISIFFLMKKKVRIWRVVEFWSKPWLNRGNLCSFSYCPSLIVRNVEQEEIALTLKFEL